MDTDDEKLAKARKRVDELKKFYKHFSAYIIINLFFIGRRIYKDIYRGDTVFEAFTDITNYNFFFWWGVGLIIHTILVFGAPRMLSKDWEAKKIEELMKKK